jgi:exosortase A
MSTALPGAMLMVALLLVFAGTAVAMVTIWYRSETFAHAFLVPPIAAWLVWRRREELATVVSKPAPWVLVPMAVACLLWLLGELGSVAAASQFALVALLVLAVPAVYGMQVAGTLLFPLLFTFFAVPLGEFMVPYMMEWTADFTVAALQLTGVPVFREGLQFVIPSGNWSVVEACSGVRYLIASFMVGTLFAYLNFRSPRRRAVFMVFSLLVPVLANWFRAYLIVMLGHLSGNKLAAGADHIVYGWVFFGIVIGIMFLVGARWAEPEGHVAAAGRTPTPTSGASGAVAWGVAAAALALALATQAAGTHLGRRSVFPVPPLALPAMVGDEWHTSADALSDWVPNFLNPTAVASRNWHSGPHRVGVWVGYYRDQGTGRAMVSSTNTLVLTSEHAPWAQVASASYVQPSPRGASAWRTADLRGSLSPDQQAAPRLRVWRAYWVGGRLTTSDAGAKILQALNRLAGRGDDSAVLLFYTPLAEKGDADATLARFVAAALPPIEATLATAQAAR